MTEKPTCPSHPNAAVIHARVPCTEDRYWLCLVCASNLGPVDESVVRRETISIESTDVGSLDELFSDMKRTNDENGKTTTPHCTPLCASCAWAIPLDDESRGRCMNQACSQYDLLIQAETENK